MLTWKNMNLGFEITWYYNWVANWYFTLHGLWVHSTILTWRRWRCPLLASMNWVEAVGGRQQICTHCQLHPPQKQSLPWFLITDLRASGKWIKDRGRERERERETQYSVKLSCTFLIWRWNEFQYGKQNLGFIWAWEMRLPAPTCIPDDTSKAKFKHMLERNSTPYLMTESNIRWQQTFATMCCKLVTTIVPGKFLGI